MGQRGMLRGLLLLLLSATAAFAYSYATWNPTGPPPVWAGQSITLNFRACDEFSCRSRLSSAGEEQPGQRAPPTTQPATQGPHAPGSTQKAGGGGDGEGRATTAPAQGAAGGGAASRDDPGTAPAAADSAQPTVPAGGDAARSAGGAAAHPDDAQRGSGQGAAAAASAAATAAAAAAAAAVPAAGGRAAPASVQQREGPTGEGRREARIAACEYCDCSDSGASCSNTYDGHTGGVTIYVDAPSVVLSDPNDKRRSLTTQQQRQGPVGAEDRAPEQRLGGTSLFVVTDAGGGGTVVATSQTGLNTYVRVSNYFSTDVPVTWKDANWGLSLAANPSGPYVPLSTSVTYTATLTNTVEGRDAAAVAAVQPVSGVTVTFKDQGGLTLPGGSLATDGEGNAAVTLTLDTAGTFDVTATTSTFTSPAVPVTSSTVSLEVDPKWSLQVTATPSSGIKEGDAVTLIATLLNRGVTPVRGASVSIYQTIMPLGRAAGAADTADMWAHGGRRGGARVAEEQDNDDQQDDVDGAMRASLAAVRDAPRVGKDAGRRAGDKLIGNGSTDVAGRFSVRWVAQQGTFTFYATTTDPLGTLVTSDAGSDAVVTVAGADPALVVLAPRHAVRPVGEPVKFTVMVLDGASHPVRGAPVTFVVNGTCDATFGPDGEPPVRTTDGTGFAHLLLCCRRGPGVLTVVASAPLAAGGVVESEPSRIEFLHEDEYDEREHPEKLSRHYRHFRHGTAPPRGGYDGAGGDDPRAPYHGDGARHSYSGGRRAGRRSHDDDGRYDSRQHGWLEAEADEDDEGHRAQWARGRVADEDDEEDDDATGRVAAWLRAVHAEAHVAGRGARTAQEGEEAHGPAHRGERRS